MILSRSLKETPRAEHGTSEKPKRPAESGYDCYPLHGVREVLRLLSALRRKIGSVTAPALVIHARGDHRVTHRDAVSLVRRIASEKKELLLLDHPCHTIQKGRDRERIESAVLEFIRRELPDQEKGKKKPA